MEKRVTVKSKQPVSVAMENTHKNKEERSVVLTSKVVGVCKTCKTDKVIEVRKWKSGNVSIMRGCGCCAELEVRGEEVGGEDKNDKCG